MPPGDAIVQVAVNGNPAATVPCTILSSAPGIFMLPQGRAAIVNSNGTINSVDQPAVTGRAVAAFVTGLGTASPPVAEGQPAPSDPLSRVTAGVSAMIGSTPLRWSLPDSRLRSPGFIR